MIACKYAKFSLTCAAGHPHQLLSSAQPAREASLRLMSLLAASRCRLMADFSLNPSKRQAFDLKFDLKARAKKTPS